MYSREEDKKDKLIAALVSIGVTGLLVLFLILYRIYTPNPPFEFAGEGGMEMNFGTYNEGTGEVENNGIGAATSVVTEEEPVNTTPTSNETVTPAENGEPVLEEKNDQPKVQNNATVITPVKPKNTNSSLINNFIKNNDKPGTTGGDGNSGNPGNSGVPDGNPNTNGQGGTGNNPNYIGNGNSQGGPGGIGINLAGRKVLVPPDPVNDSKEEGVVVVTIKVDKKGNVIEAETNGRGTTTTSPILKAKAHQAALKAKFSPSDAFEEQIGTMKFVFKF